MLSRNVETFLACESGFPESKIVLLGAPFDSTCSYRPGARFGPEAMRHESYGIESYSPYQDVDLSECAVFDSGNLELCFGDAKLALKDIRERVSLIRSAGKLPLMLGGEHLVTLGAVQAIARLFPGLHILHFDAHADLREDYLGVTLSHACVIRRCFELLGEGRIHQFCIRSGLREEFSFARNHTDFHPYGLDGLSEVCDQLRREDIPVYLTIDLDCLDPSVFPGTGTPEAGGISFLDLLSAIRTVSHTRIVGADVVEFSPNLDQGGISSATACKVVRELIAAVSAGERQERSV